MQITWSGGFLSIAVGLLQLLSCLLVKATKSKSPVNHPIPDPELYDTMPLSDRVSQDALPEDAPLAETDERERERSGYQKLFGLLPEIFFWPSLSLSIFAGSLYPKAEHSASQAKLLQRLR